MKQTSTAYQVGNILVHRTHSTMAVFTLRMPASAMMNAFLLVCGIYRLASLARRLSFHFLTFTWPMNQLAAWSKEWSRMLVSMSSISDLNLYVKPPGTVFKYEMTHSDRTYYQRSRGTEQKKLLTSLHTNEHSRQLIFTGV